MVGCHCRVCRSEDPRDRRNRCSVVVELPEGALLIDTPPELRLACLAHGVHRIDAVALTHTHADHIMGMDDVRRFNDIKRAVIPVYGEAPFLSDIRRVFQYVFVQTQAGGGKPRLELIPIEPDVPIPLLGSSVLPLRIMHGELPITAYRIGRFAYVTDASVIGPETMAALTDLDTLILGAIRDKPHTTHFCIPEALEIVRQLAPRRAFFTHLTHDVEYAELAGRLPPGVLPAHDGLTLEIADH
jgi:phosphoribosyl 1,2-cyclic phosphate phosphodiesterase